MKFDKFELVKEEYAYGGVFLGLLTEDGEPYCDITCCIPGVTGNSVIGIDHNFRDLCPELCKNFVEEYCEKYVGSYPSGYVLIDLYRLNDKLKAFVECVA